MKPRVFDIKIDYERECDRLKMENSYLRSEHSRLKEAISALVHDSLKQE
jgi:hypothetical protein